MASVSLLGLSTAPLSIAPNNMGLSDSGDGGDFGQALSNAESNSTGISSGLSPLSGENSGPVYQDSNQIESSSMSSSPPTSAPPNLSEPPSAQNADSSGEAANSGPNVQSQEPDLHSNQTNENIGVTSNDGTSSSTETNSTGSNPTPGSETVATPLNGFPQPHLDPKPTSVVTQDAGSSKTLPTPAVLAVVKNAPVEEFTAQTGNGGKSKKAAGTQSSSTAQNANKVVTAQPPVSNVSIQSVALGSSAPGSSAPGSSVLGSPALGAPLAAPVVTSQAKVSGSTTNPVAGATEAAGASSGTAFPTSPSLAVAAGSQTFSGLGGSDAQSEVSQLTLTADAGAALQATTNNLATMLNRATGSTAAAGATKPVAVKVQATTQTSGSLNAVVDAHSNEATSLKDSVNTLLRDESGTNATLTVVNGGLAAKTSASASNPSGDINGADPATKVNLPNTAAGAATISNPAIQNLAQTQQAAISATGQPANSVDDQNGKGAEKTNLSSSTSASATGTTTTFDPNATSVVSPTAGTAGGSGNAGDSGNNAGSRTGNENGSETGTKAKKAVVQVPTTPTDSTSSGGNSTSSSASVSSTQVGLDVSATTAADQGTLDQATRLSAVRQVSGQLQVLAATKPSNPVTIELSPQGLGTVSITVKGIGKAISAELSATNEGVRSALNEGKSALTQSMQDKGYSVSELNIRGHMAATQAGNSSGTNNQSRQDSSQPQNNNGQSSASSNQANSGLADGQTNGQANGQAAGQARTFGSPITEDAEVLESVSTASRASASIDLSI